MVSKSFLVLAAGWLLASTALAEVTIIQRINGEDIYDNFGDALAMVGDFNRDGYGDYVMGARFNDTGGDSSGIARVYSGKDNAVLFTLTGVAGDLVGFSVAGAGDVDSDGWDDVIIGAPGVDWFAPNSGAAYVYSGRTGLLIRALREDLTDDYFGAAVAGAGDVNNDGYDDVIVGASREGNGTVRVYSGANWSVIHTFRGNAPQDLFGHSVDGIGDANGDGYDDVIVGAPFGDTGGNSSGYAKVFSGRTGTLLYSYSGNTQDYLGFSVSGAGDYNNDGFDDFMIGSPFDDAGGPSSGRVFVMSGFNGSIYRTYTGQTPDAHFGWSLSEGGDYEGNGMQCVVVGAPGETGGSLSVFNRNSQVEHFTGRFSFGTAVGGGVDFNRDGRFDLIGGDPEYNTHGSNTGRIYVYLSGSYHASKTAYGSGWPGTNGVPGLTASGRPIFCTNITITVGNSRGSATSGLLMFGVAAASIPTSLGGTLLTLPLAVVPITLPAGGLVLPFGVLCDTAFAGFHIYMQALVLDPGASRGVSFTYGLDLKHGGE